MNLLDFQLILDASTPDGRWNLLQEFLKKNPEWKKKVNRWLTLDPDTAAIQLQADLAERMGMPVALFAKMINPGLREKARAAIESLQTLYQERQTNNQTEKEIKNVRTKPAHRLGKTARRRNQ